MLNEAFLRAILIAETNPMDKITILYDHHCTACGSQCRAVQSYEDGSDLKVVWQCSLCHTPETITYKEAQ